MTRRSKLNLLSAAIIAAGGLALSGATPAQAAAFGGCDDMHAALDEAAAECWEMGGTHMTYSGSCGANGYTLTTNCYVEIEEGEP